MFSSKVGLCAFEGRTMKDQLTNAWKLFAIRETTNHKYLIETTAIMHRTQIGNRLTDQWNRTRKKKEDSINEWHMHTAH